MVFKTISFGRSDNPPSPQQSTPWHHGSMRALLPVNRTPTVQEIPIPIPGPGQVLIQVAASGVNRADLLQTAGHYPPPPDAPATLGLELAGTVTALGPGADPALLHTPVLALVDGGAHAEYALADSHLTAPIPPHLDAAHSAALPEALATASSNLVGTAHLAAGQTVLVHGGAGGVGHVAIQLARHVGARVLATVGTPAKEAWVRSLGAEPVNYHDDVVARVLELTQGKGADVIWDVLGAGGLADNLRMLAPDGQLLVIGLQRGRTAELNLGELLAKRLTVHGTTLRARPLAQKRQIWAGAQEFAPHLTPHVHAALPLADAARAFDLLGGAETRGKVVLTPGA